MNDIRIVGAGDAVLVAEFEERIDAAVNARAIALADALGREPLPGIRDIVPTFRSVAVYFDPLSTDVERLTMLMREIASVSDATHAQVTADVEIPVCYDTEFGPDVEDVARFAGIDREDVIATHVEREYRVFMLGFLPGFAYLGTVDRRIAAPRRATPRLSVPAGSVGIAGQQTGIYPLASPGGWNIIGRTPLRLVSLSAPSPTLLKPGQTVRFRTVDRREFNRIAADVERVSWPE